MQIKLISKKKKELLKEEILDICKLKNETWKYGLKSQLNFFNENTLSNDLHNLFFINSKLIGYTVLKKRSCLFNKIKSKYILFDTLVIKKKFRKKNFSKLIMDFNNIIIEQQKIFAILFCSKKLIKFYKKFNWINIKNSNVSTLDHSSFSYAMIFDYKKSKKKLSNFSIYVYK